MEEPERNKHSSLTVAPDAVKGRNLVKPMSSNQTLNTGKPEISTTTAAATGASKERNRVISSSSSKTQHTNAPGKAPVPIPENPTSNGNRAQTRPVETVHFARSPRFPSKDRSIRILRAGTSDKTNKKMMTDKRLQSSKEVEKILIVSDQRLFSDQLKFPQPVVCNSEHKKDFATPTDGIANATKSLKVFSSKDKSIQIIRAGTTNITDGGMVTDGSEPPSKKMKKVAFIRSKIVIHSKSKLSPSDICKIASHSSKALLKSKNPAVTTTLPDLKPKPSAATTKPMVDQKSSRNVVILPSTHRPGVSGKKQSVHSTNENSPHQLMAAEKFEDFYDVSTLGKEDNLLSPKLSHVKDENLEKVDNQAEDFFNPVVRSVEGWAGGSAPLLPVESCCSDAEFSAVKSEPKDVEFSSLPNDIG